MGIAKRLRDVSRGGRNIDFRLDPADEKKLERLFTRMSQDMQKKITRKALKTGGRLFIIEAQRRSPSDRVESNIKGISRTVKGVQGYVMGPSVGLPNPAWFEYGTNKEYTGRNPRAGRGYVVDRTKRLRLWNQWFTLPSGKKMMSGIKPKRFIRNSWDEKKTAVANKVADVIKTEIERIK